MTPQDSPKLGRQFENVVDLLGIKNPLPDDVIKAARQELQIALMAPEDELLVLRGPERVALLFSRIVVAVSPNDDPLIGCFAEAAFADDGNLVAKVTVQSPDEAANLKAIIEAMYNQAPIDRRMYLV